VGPFGPGPAACRVTTRACLYCRIRSIARAAAMASGRPGPARNPSPPRPRPTRRTTTSAPSGGHAAQPTRPRRTAAIRVHKGCPRLLIEACQGPCRLH